MQDVTGTGALYSPYGDIYEGSIREGRMDGEGTLSYYNGCKLQGEWENGQLVDDGKYFYSPSVWIPRSSGRNFEGNGVFTPIGKLINEDGFFDIDKGICPFAFQEVVELSMCRLN